MTWLVQSVVILLNQTSLNRVFSRIYELGVRRVIAALASHPAVACILGSGSYFENRATYGLSDVDLIIVLSDQVTRADPAIRELAYAYERVRRIFPFLGKWPEKEANLIFLSDIAAGFPAPESFRVRFKQGRLVRLYGELPSDFCSGAITISEVLVEVDTLLRFSLVTNPKHATRLVFWKRVFNKLIGLAGLLDLQDLLQEIRNQVDLGFLAEADVRLFFRKSDPARLFALQLSLSRRFFDTIAAREATVKISPTILSKSASNADLARSSTPIPFSYAFGRSNSHLVSVRSIPSIPIGLVPRMLYFPIDDRIPLLEINQPAYDGLQRLRHALTDQAQTDENALVSVERIPVYRDPSAAVYRSRTIGSIAVR